MRTPTGSNASRPCARWKVFGLAFVLTLAPMLTWALGTPLMASPDEPAHAIRAAGVARGDLFGRPSVVKQGQIDVDVPRWVEHSAALSCFAFHPTIPASCQQPLQGDPNEIVTANTSTALNSPVYYLLTGWPSLFVSGNVGFYLMRALSAVLTAGLLAFAFMAVRQFPRKRWATLALTAAVTPMVLFLGGVLNPNAVEFAAAAAVLATLVLTFTQPAPGFIFWERCFIIVLSVFLLTSTRNISFLWLGLALIIALLSTRWTTIRQLLPRLATWLTLALVVVVCGFALMWFTRKFDVGGGTTGLSFADTFVSMIQRALDYSQGWVGVFGWLDRPASFSSIAIWTTVVVAITVAALLFARRRFRIAIAIIAVAIVLVPALIESAVAPTIGGIWQGRYTLALLFFLMIICGIALDDSQLTEPQRVTRAREWNRVFAATLVLIGIGQVTTFVWVLERYVVGSDDVWHMIVNPIWQPKFTWEGLTALLAVVSSIGLWFVWRSIRLIPVNEPTDASKSLKGVSGIATPTGREKL